MRACTSKLDLLELATLQYLALALPWHKCYVLGGLNAPPPPPRSGLEKRFILILVQFLEIFLKFFEEEVSDYLS